jgi:hypothetical protein
VAEEGPKRGLSFKGSKENLPRNLATHFPSSLLCKCLGQLLMHITTMKTATFATTNIGTSHDVL